MIFNIFTLMSLTLIESAIASPTNITAREDLPPADTSNESCAKCINEKGNIEYLWASGKCNTLPDGHKYYACGKLYRCGICMLFKGEQCMGDMVPTDENSQSGWKQSDLQQAQSHYCISG